MNDFRENPLNAVDVRIIGALIEKEGTTPDNYPLTLNALTLACNQTSNREPVMKLDETTVLKSLDDLTRRSLVRAVLRNDSRARRYKHLLSESLSLHAAETAGLCILMLRGPQTVGEIKTRTARLFDFVDLAHVEITLQALMTMSVPLVVQLPRRPGQKELRYAHLLSGEPELPEIQEADPVPPTRERSAQTDRVAELEASVETLRAEVAELRAQLEEFRREFQ